MTHITQARTRARSAGRTGRGGTRKSRKNGLTDSLIEAVVEVGHAAENLRSSWEHLKKAQRRGEPALRPMVRATRKAAAAVGKATKRATGAVRKAVKRRKR